MGVELDEEVEAKVEDWAVGVGEDDAELVYESLLLGFGFELSDFFWSLDFPCYWEESGVLDEVVVVVELSM